MKNFSKIIVCMFILTSLFFYCSTAKADDCDSNVIELYDYETGQTSNISISDYSINFLPASGIIVDTPIPTKIIGTDNQWQAPKGEYPFTSIMFLAILYDSGRIATGTGFLVGSNVMATAGHNFKTTENGYLETATQMRIFPTMDDLSPDMIESLDDFKGEWCYPKSWFSGRGSSVPTSSYSNANDWAIVKIRKNYGDQYGYFGVTSSGPDYPGVNIAGYPSNPLKSYHIYAAYDLVKDYNVSAQKTPAVRKNVRGMNAPITNNATIIPTGFSSGIVGFSWPDVLQNAVIRCIALLFQEKHFR